MDMSMKEQLVFCTHWVNYNLEVFEKILDFLWNFKYYWWRSCSWSIDEISTHPGYVANSIFRRRRQHAWKILWFCSTDHNIQSRIHCTHSCAHSLPLLVRDVNKKVKILMATMRCAEEIIFFIKYYSNWEKLSSLKKEMEYEIINIWLTDCSLKISETRWRARTVYGQVGSLVWEVEWVKIYSSRPQREQKWK